MTSISSLLPKPKYSSGSRDSDRDDDGIEKSGNIVVTNEISQQQRELLAKVSLIS
jgi:hypothetical protein